MRYVILFVLLVGTVASAQEPVTQPWTLTECRPARWSAACGPVVT